MAATLDARLRLNSAEFSGGLNRALRDSNAFVGKMSTQFNSLRNVLAGGVVGFVVTDFVRGMFEAAMQMERLEVAMKATTGSTVLGKARMEDIKQLAGEIGMGIEVAARAMIQLQSAGLSAADSMRFIKSGFNAVVATGGGDEEFKRVAYGMQQVLSAGRFLQEDINIIREALPTAGRLMQEAFGANRAEDLQKLNISTREFVSVLVSAMEGLPQVGDTMLKQIGRFQMGITELKAQLGESLMPAAGVAMSETAKFLEIWKNQAKQIGEMVFRLYDGGDPKQVKEQTKTSKRFLELVEKEKQALKDRAAEEKANADAMAQSVKNGETLRGVIEKLQVPFKAAAAAMRELRDAMTFEDNTRTFLDAEQNQAWQDGLDATRQQLSETIQAKRDAKREALADAFNEFVGPQQMTDEAKGAWQKLVEEQGMSRSDKKAQRDADRELEKNTRRAADERTRAELREEKKRARDQAFNDLKNNKGFFDEEATKKRLRDKNRAEAKEAVKGAAQTLLDIKGILERLATA